MSNTSTKIYAFSTVVCYELKKIGYVLYSHDYILTVKGSRLMQQQEEQETNTGVK